MPIWWDITPYIISLNDCILPQLVIIILKYKWKHWVLSLNKRPKHRHLIQNWQLVNSKNSGNSTTSSPTWNPMLQRRWALWCSAEIALNVLCEPDGSCIYEERNRNQKLYEADWRCEFRVYWTIFRALKMKRVMSYNLWIIICNCLHNKPRVSFHNPV